MIEDLLFPMSLGSDNHAGVHPKILQAIERANRGHAHAYGKDELCEQTHKEFCRLFGDAVQAEYVFTGTAANVLSLATSVRSYQAVIASQESHLHNDECGAPEKFLGSKLYLLSGRDGKIHPHQCASLFERMGDQHFSQPRALSLTQPTELGTCYTVTEMREWRDFCKEKNLMFHIDGTRLANAAVTLGQTLHQLTAGVGADVVSFGGTKNGLLGAETVLLFSETAKKEFKFYRKQAMQLSSKTRFLAAQFYAYLQDDLWAQIAKHTTQLAKDLETSLEAFPEIRVVYPVQSNALFVQLPKAWIRPLRDKFFFYIWDSESRICRWMISWDWNPHLNQKLIEAIEEVRICHPIKR